MLTSPTAVSTSAVAPQPPISVAAGIHAYVVTPADKSGRLLRTSHELVVERVLAAGCEGVTVLGATGEFPYVPERLRNELISTTVELVAGRAAVITGVGGFSFDEIARQADVAQKLGTDGLLVMLQGFFALSRQDQVGLFSRLARQVDAPMVIYVNPAVCNVRYSVDALLEIADNDKVVAIKDASGSLSSFEHADRFAERQTSLFTATATPLTAAFLLGARGWMSGTATILPELCHQFYQACTRQDWVSASRIEQQLSAALGAFRSAGPAIIKALLNAQGIDVGEPLGPAASVPRDTAITILQAIENSTYAKES